MLVLARNALGIRALIIGLILLIIGGYELPMRILRILRILQLRRLRRPAP